MTSRIYGTPEDRVHHFGPVVTDVVELPSHYTMEPYLDGSMSYLKDLSGEDKVQPKSEPRPENTSATLSA